MEIKSLLKSTRNLLEMYDEYYGQEVGGEIAENITGELENIQNLIFLEGKEEIDRVRESLKKKIKELKEKSPSDNEKINVYKTALGYLEFYSLCDIDESYTSVEARNKEIEGRIMASDWAKILDKVSDNEEEREILKSIIIRNEVELLYTRALDKSGCDNLCLDAYNYGNISWALADEKAYFLSYTGPLSESENEHLTYDRKDRLKNKDGKYYSYGSVPYDSYARDLFVENSEKQIELCLKLKKIYEEAQRTGEFKGYFTTYTPTYLEKMVTSCIDKYNEYIEKADKHIETLKSKKYGR